MTLSDLFEWRRTSQALLSLEELLRCSVCASLTTQLCHVAQCEHVLCHQCVANAGSGECGKCHAPCQRSERRPASAHASLVHECQQLRKLLQLKASSSSAATRDDGEMPVVAAIPSPQQLAERVVQAARESDAGPPSYSRKGTTSCDPANKRRRRNKPPPDNPITTTTTSSSVAVPASSASSAVLSVAAIDASQDIVESAAAAAKANKRNAKGETPLHVASARGDVERVRRLLSAGARPNVSDHAGWSPLHEAGSSGAVGSVHTVKLLLGAGAVVDAAGDEHRTPLHEAVCAGNLSVATELVQAGANIHSRSLFGETPLQLAAGNDDMLAVLQETSVAPVSRTPEEQEGRLVTGVVAEALTETDTALLKAVAKKYGWKIKSEISAGVSHLILGSSTTEDRSFTQLCALQVGAYQVSVEWLYACASCTLPVAPSALQWQLKEQAVQRSMVRFSARQPLLFSGLHIYLQGEFDGGSLQRPQLCQVVQLAGASLLSRPPNPEAIPASERTVPFHAGPDSQLYRVSHVVVYKQRPSMRYDMVHVKSLSLDWLLLCLQTYTLAEPF